MSTGTSDVVREQIADVAPLPSFGAAATQVLQFLHDRVGMGLWMVTRTAGEDWVVLHAEDHGYGVEAGTVFRWSDSFCSRMVRGLGPRIAVDAQVVPVYREAPLGRQVPIGSYVGIPLADSEGQLFGTLCAIDPSPQPARLQREQGLIELQGRLLSSVLSTELRALDVARRAELAERHADRDAMTGLLNRRGWDGVVAAEEERCARYASPAAVLALDLDGLQQVNDTGGHAAGDELVVRAAQLLRRSCRSTDVVARLGGDEFGVLAVETTTEDGARLRARLRALFADAGVEVSIGVAGRYPALPPHSGLDDAWRQADALLYQDKRSRRAARRAAACGIPEQRSPERLTRTG